jgi:hypothetical protein
MLSRVPVAIGAVHSMLRQERKGSKKAAAANALVRAVSRHGAMTSTGAAMPSLNKAPIIVPSAHTLTAAQHTQLASVLSSAVAKSVPVSRQIAPPVGHFQ